MRIFQEIHLELNSYLTLDEKASHHLMRVLRVKVGDFLFIFNGKGGEFEAKITAINKKNVSVFIEKFCEKNVESPLEICLLQGIARGEKMDFIVQKAVELGVKKIVPLITERGNVRLNEARENKRLAHWKGVLVSACEQSGRTILPEILAPLSLPEWLSLPQKGELFVLSPHAENRLKPEKSLSHPNISLLIGPEGGLSEKEIKLAQEVGFLPLNLGPRILRTETASLAALTFFQTLYGDMHR